MSGSAVARKSSPGSSGAQVLATDGPELSAPGSRSPAQTPRRILPSEQSEQANSRQKTRQPEARSNETRSSRTTRPGTAYSAGTGLQAGAAGQPEAGTLPNLGAQSGAGASQGGPDATTGSTEASVSDIPETVVTGNPDAGPLLGPDSASTSGDPSLPSEATATDVADPTSMDALDSEQGPVAEGPTLREEPVRNIPSSVSVITREQLDQRPGQTVADLLRGVPGLDVVQPGIGRAATVFLRGASSEQTKVLLDGVPLNDPMTTGRLFDFAQLTTDGLERIEIIRGPQSSLYGSDAIGGVINLVTRRGSGPLSGHVGSLGGSYNTGQVSGSAQAGDDISAFSFSGSYLDTQGFSAADARLPGNAERDGFQNGVVSGRMDWNLSEDFDANFVFRTTDSRSEIDDGGGPFADDPNEVNRLDQNFARLELHHQVLDEGWDQRLFLSHAQHVRQISDPTDLLHLQDAFFSRFSGETHMLDWRHQFLLWENNTLTAGLVHLQETGLSSFVGDSAFGPFSGGTPKLALRDTAFYVQDEWQLAETWFASVSTRQDHYSQAGTATTYRATSLFRMPATQTAFRGSLGTGFKAPTLFQLFDPFSGNAGLAPEESKGWDCGLEQPMLDNNLTMSGTYFRNDFDNLIDFNPATFTYFNIGQARTAGVELLTTARLDEWRDLTLTYTHTDTLDLATGLELLRRPRHKWSLAYTRRFSEGKGHWGCTLTYVGTRPDRDFSTFPFSRVTLGEYWLLGLNTGFQVTEKVQVVARADNLLNEQYQEVFGFGTAGPSVYAGVNYHW